MGAGRGPPGPARPPLPRRLGLAHRRGHAGAPRPGSPAGAARRGDGDGPRRPARGGARRARRRPRHPGRAGRSTSEPPPAGSVVDGARPARGGALSRSSCRRSGPVHEGSSGTAVTATVTGPGPATICAPAEQERVNDGRRHIGTASRRLDTGARRGHDGRRAGPVDRAPAGQGGGGRRRRRARGRPRHRRCPTAPRWRSSPPTPTPGATCCATRPPTSWPRRCSGCGPAPTTPSGPSIDDGFYYDFELPGGAHFSDDDLERIEAEMRAIIAEDQPFVREEHNLDEGLELFADQPFKHEIIEAVGAGEPTRSTPSGVAWSAPTATRTPSSTCAAARTCPRPAGSGTSSSCGWPAPTGAATSTARSCSASTARPGSPRRRSPSTCTGSRRPSGATTASSGAELDLFSFPEEIGSGLAVFHPKGGHHPPADGGLLAPAPRRGRLPVRLLAPHHQGELFEISGHLDWFAEGMYPADGARRRHAVLPQADELPVPHPDLPEPAALLPRAADAAVRVRHGLPLREVRRGPRAHPGAGHDPGRRPHLLHPRADGRRARRTLHFVLDLLRDFGLDDFYLELSTKPQGKAVGSDEEWDEATEALRTRRSRSGLELVMDEGGGAFYGPKISVQARDAIGRTWQMSTIQLDFQMPQRFGLEYVGRRQRPAPPDHDPPGPVRLGRALLRHPARALRRRPADLADARAGPGAPGDRRPRRLRRVGRRRPAPAAGCGSSVDASGGEARRADPPGQAGEDPLRPGGGRRRRRGRDRRGQPPRRPADPSAGVAVGRLRRRGGRRGRAQGAARGPGARPRSRAGRRRRTGEPRAALGRWRREYVVEATDAERPGTEEDDGVDASSAGSPRAGRPRGQPRRVARRR